MLASADAQLGNVADNKQCQVAKQRKPAPTMQARARYPGAGTRGTTSDRRHCPTDVIDYDGSCQIVRYQRASSIADLRLIVKGQRRKKPSGSVERVDGSVAPVYKGDIELATRTDYAPASAMSVFEGRSAVICSPLVLRTLILFGP
jgi:hypothetical protein